MEWDKIEDYRGARIQHGPNNRRTYVMRVGDLEVTELLSYLNSLVEKYGYTKSFAKVPSSKSPCFLADGWNIEAFVPGFFRDREDAMFLAKYHDPERRKVSPGIFTRLCKQINELGIEHPSPLPECLHYHSCGKSDVRKICILYRRVFARYPFPIHDESYIQQTMDENVDYFGIWEGKNLIALSSAEKNYEESNVEMTDFAVLPDYRGLGLALYLLCHMDAEMAEEGIITAYTIARLNSGGMNATFLKAGYEYSGTLFNNTNISEGLENMNVYYRKLSNSSSE